jgi:hypothetical protein
MLFKIISKVVGSKGLHKGNMVLRITKSRRLYYAVCLISATGISYIGLDD